MTLSLLEHFLPTQLFAFMLLFSRMGSALMVIPGFGDAYISPRIRLLFALSLSFLLLPLLAEHMPAMPANPFALGIILIGEITVGLAFGLCVRILLSGMHVAGTIIAAQASLSVANMFDVSNSGQSTVVSNFLVLMALVMFFTLNLHHVVLQGLVESYLLFPAGQMPSMGDLSELTSRSVASAFAIGVQLSAPHLVFGLIFYLGGGIMARLMPQMQVFYVLMSVQILLAFLLLALTLSALMGVYAEYLGDALLHLFRE